MNIAVPVNIQFKYKNILLDFKHSGVISIHTIKYDKNYQMKSGMLNHEYKQLRLIKSYF